MNCDIDDAVAGLGDPDRLRSTPDLKCRVAGPVSDREKPVRAQPFAPHIVLRTNLPLFTSRIAGTAGTMNG